MTRSSRRYSGCGPRDGLQDPRELALRVAVEARRKGLRISTAEIVEATRLLALYTAVAGFKPQSPEEIAFVLASVYTKRAGEERIVREAVEELFGRRQAGNPARRIEEEIERDLQSLGLYYGAKLRRRDYASSSRARSAYARLRLLGIIRKGRKGEYVVSSSQARRMIDSLARRYGGYREAVRDAIKQGIKRNGSLIATMGVDVLNYIDLRDFSVDELVKLYRYAGRDKQLRRIVSRLIADKVGRGEHYTSAESVYEILRREGVLSQHHLRNILERNPRLAEKAARDFGREALLDIAAEMARHDREGAVEVALRALGARSSRRGALSEILERNEPGLLSSIGEAPDEVLDTLNTVATAKSYLLKGLSDPTGAALEYAEYELGRAVVRWEEIRKKYHGRIVDIIESEMLQLRQLLEAARRGDAYTILKGMVRHMDAFGALKLLHEVYSSTGDGRLRNYALMLMKKLWREARARYGLRPSRRTRFSPVQGRLHVRRTLANLVRLNPSPLVRRAKYALRQYVVVVDKSGSMKPYAVYAVLVASSLAASIRRLVVFDENVTVYNNLSRLYPLRVVDLIFSTKFSGYTDIVSALQQAAAGLNPGHLVLVSDLRQTVAASARVEEVLEGLWRRGWWITIVLPPRYDVEVAQRIQSYARLHVVRSAEDVARVMMRIVRA